MKAFDTRINDLPLEEGASLRDCREIVAGMLVDLEARLPDQYPPKLAALLAFEDGREEGSRHPNFLSDQVKTLWVRYMALLSPGV